MQALFDDDWDIQHIAEEVDRWQLLENGPTGYRLRRIILANYWLYETQVFEIPHGRLFLAGANASGKSTVLTAALPLLLEGDLKASRLDTFGRQSRHIEYYILGDETSSTAFTIAEDKRTAYLALEFEWCDPDNPPIAHSLHQVWENGKSPFLTLGMSITGNKKAASDRIKPMHFLITDGSRLFETIHFPGPKVTVGQFRDALREHGVICGSQREYAHYVAQYLFGIGDSRTFHKLINLLLALRQPNLSSQLALKDVHNYLTNSLPTLPGDITRRAVHAVDIMEDLTMHLRNLAREQREAQEIAEAQDTVLLTEAHLAVHSYTLHFSLHRVLDARLQAFRSRIQADVEELAIKRQIFHEHEQAKQQALGSIQALEQKEGIKLAERLAQSQVQLDLLRGQVSHQQQSLETLQKSLSLQTQKQSQQTQAFQNAIQDAKHHLQVLFSIAENQARWPEAVAQINLSLQQVETLPAPEASVSQVVEQMTWYLHLDAEKHLNWLRHLSLLHQRKNDLTREIERNTANVGEKQADVDSFWKHFRVARRRFETALVQVNQALEQMWIDSNRLASASTEASLVVSINIENDPDLEEHAHSLKESSVLLDDMQQRLQESQRNLIAVQDILTRGSLQIQTKREQILPQIVEKKIRYQDTQQVYLQKQTEQETLPAHPLHRTSARNMLSARGIRAFPLYLLIDFMLDLPGEEGGRIEHMLEDAGLLDALVILEQDVAQADLLLSTENISDYRIDLESLPFSLVDTTQNAPKLCFDQAARDLVDDTYVAWEALIARIVPALEQALTQGQANDKPVPGRWKHGLLAGQSGRGSAQFIGRSTRLQEKKRELEILQAQMETLKQALDDLNQQDVHFKNQGENLQRSLSQLQMLKINNNLDAAYNEAQVCSRTLAQAQQHLRDARDQLSQQRRQRTQVLQEMEDASRPYPLFAQQAEMVGDAHKGTVRIDEMLRHFCRDLPRLAELDQEIRDTLNLLRQTRAGEEGSSVLFQQWKNQLLQEESAFQELQQLAEQEGVEDLSQRLQNLRQRVTSLDAELFALGTKLAVLKDRVQTQPEDLTKLTQDHQISQFDLQKKLEIALELLSVVPHNLSEEMLLHFDTSSEVLIRQFLQISDQESDASNSQDMLERAYKYACDTLREAFYKYASSLHTYEPEFDEQGKRVFFRREDEATPARLVQIIEKDMHLQQELLRDEERGLFEQFLLEDMADLLRMHIIQATDWIKEINASLATMPFVGDRYELEWLAKTSFEEQELPFGRLLAQHLPLLQRSAHELSEKERERLKEAFLQEIRHIGVPQNDDESLNVEQRLQAIFDYRQWFQFRIYTISQAGQRQHLTHKLLASRSGAEQLFALYVPLLAALSSIYNSAAPGAPRLLGLDEAFDKASLNNMQKMISFLAQQGFQWIMTGPQLNISGAKVPVIVRYVMLREDTIATAIPQIWQGRLDMSHPKD